MLQKQIPRVANEIDHNTKDYGLKRLSVNHSNYSLPSVKIGFFPNSRDEALS